MLALITPLYFRTFREEFLKTFRRKKKTAAVICVPMLEGSVRKPSVSPDGRQWPPHVHDRYRFPYGYLVQWYCPRSEKESHLGTSKRCVSAMMRMRSPLFPIRMYWVAIARDFNTWQLSKWFLPNSISHRAFTLLRELLLMNLFFHSCKV